MTTIPDNTGYATTLDACREHIDDAVAAITAVRNMLNAFCESYVDVKTDVFIRRASLSHGQYSTIFNATMDVLHDASSMLRTAKALSVGADLIATNAISSASDDE